MTVTKLHRAAETGNLEAVLQLLAEGADPDAPDGIGRTPLRCRQSDNLPPSEADREA